MRSQVPDVVVLPEIVSWCFGDMSTKLKTSHSFPKDRTIENSDISPSKQSAGDDDDEICGKGVQRTRVHAIYSSSFSPPQTTHQTLSYKSLIRTCHANAERRRREQANEYRVCIPCPLSPLPLIPGWSHFQEPWWLVDWWRCSFFKPGCSVLYTIIIIQNVLLYFRVNSAEINSATEILREIKK